MKSISGISNSYATAKVLWYWKQIKKTSLLSQDTAIILLLTFWLSDQDQASVWLIKLA